MARILCVVDRPRWAHCRKTDALARSLADRYEIVKRYQPEVTAADLEQADAVLLYYWLQIDRFGELRSVLERRRDRLLVGICSHFELSGGWREPGVEALRSWPRAVFANNRLLCEEFEPLLERAIHYTPNGVDTAFFVPRSVPDPAADPARLRVGWAGSLTNQGPEQRGVHELIAPAAAVVGAELSLAVREERWRDQDEMLRFYHSIDVYVCASRSEGTPNPCLEAAACGLPIVTTRVGNMPELIHDGENGLFAERNVEDIASKLERLRDPSLRARLGRAARSSVEAWDWRLQADRYDAAFRSVLDVTEPTRRRRRPTRNRR